VDEIVAPLVDDVYLLTLHLRRSDAVEGPPHVDIDHENAEWLAVSGEDRRRDA
jgi:hypothetical protein